MTWRQTLGFVDEDAAIDFATVHQRYLKLRQQRDRHVCESRRLKQAVEAARSELTRQAAKRRTRQPRF
jgi:chromosome segregation ATPase